MGEANYGLREDEAEAIGAAEGLMMQLEGFATGGSRESYKLITSMEEMEVGEEETAEGDELAADNGAEMG